ncbi:MAG: tRNA-binding protein [Bdellovibrionales bacterium]
MTITFEEFEKIDLRVGTIIRAEVNAKARKPAYKIWVDFGEEIGIKQSSAQLTVHYTPEGLIGRRVLCVVNFEPRLIAGFKSEILITGFEDANGGIVLASIDEKAAKDLPNGVKIS